MPNTLDREFIDICVKDLRQLESRIGTCLNKLSAEQVWARGSENENAIGNLALHLCGNIRQWILSGVGGAPDTRNRDAEFAARGGLAQQELSARLHATVEEACDVIGHVSAARMLERIVVQKYDVTVMEAIFHVVEHFSTHTGQIIFATKMLTSEDLGFYRHLRASAAHSEKTP